MDDFDNWGSANLPKKNNSLWIIGVLLLLALSAGIGYYFYSNYQQPADVTTVVKQIQEASELVTVKFLGVMTASKTELGAIKLGGIEIGTGSTEVVCAIVGEVIAGVDLQKLTAEDVSLKNNRLEITLPPPAILNLENTIVEGKTRCADSKNGLFPPDTALQLSDQLMEDARERIQRDACDAKILSEANQNAKKALGLLFSLAGYDSVTINVRNPEHCP